MVESNLDLTKIKEVIKSKKRQVKTYFYYGSKNDLPMKDWRTDLGVNITGSNFEDTLIKNLINALKTYTQN